ncbi:hypothetical protein BCR33DRAFT_735721 [Rhizoclosmatium globosum]|uniref:Uncharacterized protein n=1 Tax=Rhizoclosmatium globosum TaxID=329046 RepID=A0A1Y2CMU0_9FUNG|nr:hypothetical protein BCR33DRAFT_735721 [Rhizoclosmatium globosum]|eukprot:ORY48246.1 hypothetical protein BCR33DRAFT_735721 [Rhizoclosmatium globosum]
MTAANLLSTSLRSHTISPPSSTVANKHCPVTIICKTELRAPKLALVNELSIQGAANVFSVFSNSCRLAMELQCIGGEATAAGLLDTEILLALFIGVLRDSQSDLDAQFACLQISELGGLKEAPMGNGLLEELKTFTVVLDVWCKTSAGKGGERESVSTNSAVNAAGDFWGGLGLLTLGPNR